jgi:exo-beta-1,3-glucanase (GH17 family)
MQTRRAHLMSLAGLAALAPSAARAALSGPLASVCHSGRARLAPLQAAMAKGRFIAYHPTEIAFWYGKATRATKAGIAADLKALRPWFDGLITYSASHGAEHVADVAAQLGFRALIQGVWDPVDRHEIGRALSAYHRHPKLVVGLSLGNEVVLSQRGNWGDLAYGLRRLRKRVPHLPLTTTEAFAQFLDTDDARSTLAAMDFMMVNIHPIFQPWFAHAQPANWSEFVVRVIDLLAKKYCGPILVKETGVPTGPHRMGYSSAKQRAFYRALEARMTPSPSRAFAYFSAFDLPWHAYDASPSPGDHHPEEAYWGFFTDKRVPKPIISDLTRLPPKRL